MQDTPPPKQYHRPMPRSPPLSRREFLTLSGTAALVAATPSLAHALNPSSIAMQSAAPTPPIGLELYSVRTELARDLRNTLRATKQMGYELVEFYAPYLNWSLPYAKDVRLMIDDLGLRCRSTHNALTSLVAGESKTKAIELNQILGTQYVVLASPPFTHGTAEQYKTLAEQLTTSVSLLSPHGLLAGYHNHDEEWLPLSNGIRPMDFIADNTPAEFMLQLDVGTCVKAGANPVAWANAHKGRVRSAHLKDWAPGTDSEEKGYRVLFGEGVCPWRELFAALETTGGVAFYLLEQEGSRYSELETAKRCLDSWKLMRKDA